MHVRRRFLVLLGGAIFFALSLPFVSFVLLSHPAVSQAPRPIHVEVYREPSNSPEGAVSLSSPPTLLVQLVDADGRLVDHADLQTVANMPTMDMGPLAFQPQQVGHGLYVLRLSFTMPGAWWVRLDAQAPNHQKASQTLNFWVQDSPQSG